MDLLTLPLRALRTLCKERNLCGYSSKTKQEIIAMLNNTSIISLEEAERSATEWFGENDSLMREWFIRAVMDPVQHRDIGKVLAYATEVHVNKVLQKMTGRPIKSVYGASYDGETMDEPRIRHQIKFRSTGSWHLETTRRNSAKNQDTNHTGHVAYRNDEFDVLIIFVPGKAFGITGSKIRCIPVSELIDPHRPHQLITNVNPLKKKFDDDMKTINVIFELYRNR
jgi:hypothetical protein